MSFNKLSNRRGAFGVAAAILAMIAALPGASMAQADWPTRTIRIIDPSQAGSSTDVMARMIASKLGPRLGQSVVVENKPGAGTTLGIDAAAKSAPDGYTLLLTSPAVSTNVASGKRQPFDYLKDLTPIGQVALTSLILVVPSNSPFKTLKELIDEARAKPKTVRYATAGAGSMSHMGMELLGATVQAQFEHVPYRGVGPAVPDMIAGQIQVALTSVSTLQGLLESGKMRALAVASPERSPLMPNVPTTAEAGVPNYIIEYWFGLVAPTGTPPHVIARLNRELNIIAAEPDTREFLKRMATIPKGSTVEEFAKTNEQEVVRWSKLIRENNVKVQ